MPPPPSTTISTAAAAVLLTLSITLAHSCSPPPSKDAKVSCPPFKSRPPFPFSFSPGCGHPFFQIQCSFSHATISINNISFSLLQYEPNSTSLTLSPTPLSAPPPFNRHHNCSSPHTISALNRSITLGGSPFRVSDSSCSRLSALKPCPPPNLPNCSRCSWECNLIKNPLQLLHECGSSTRHREDFQPECQSDVLGVLENIMRRGFEVEWDEDQDSYFSSCKSCRASNGFCGFNSTDPEKPFICFPSQTRIKQKSLNRIAILSIIFLFMCFLIAISIGTVFFQSRRKALMAAEEDPTIIFLRRHRFRQKGVSDRGI